MLAGVFSALADVEPLSLFQKTARARVIVRGKSLSSSTRKPKVSVLEVLKGSYDGETLTIIPHWENNTNPTPWLDRSVFTKGEESILFLEPYVEPFGRDEGADVFSVLGAAQGKVEIPAEGADALTRAINRFIKIINLGQHDLQAEQLRSLLRERNPLMVEAALEQCRRFRLAQPDDIDILLDLTESPRPDFRSATLSLIGQLVRETRRVADEEGTQPQRLQSDAFERVAAAARLDSNPDVRREGIRALEAYNDNAALTIIESIGSSDASQDVRYAAQVAAHRLRKKNR